jgi:hypothetical protein
MDRGGISAAKHPFESDHAMRLHHMLKLWTADIRSRQWRVDSDLNGVSEPATKSELQDARADSEEA